MFIRGVRAKGVLYLQIAESYREAGRPKHRILCPLGSGDEQELLRIRSLLRSWRPMEYASLALEDVNGGDGTVPQSFRSPKFR
jgi:hypothetical protein